MQNKTSGYDKPENVDFVQLLMATRFFNTSLNINDILGGRCLYAYVGDVGFTSTKNIFTNDKLYWIANLYEILKQYGNLSGIVEMDDKTINIQAMNKENVDYRKGYINDHFSNFSIIGFESFTEDEQAKIRKGEPPTKNVAAKGQFPIKDIMFNYIIYNNGACIVYDSKGKIAEFMQSYDVIGEKRKIGTSIGIKLYAIGDNKNIYISQDVKLSDYWPCEVIFNSALKCANLYKFSINMVKYETQVLANYKSTAEAGKLDLKVFLIYNNVVDFNNFNVMLNFLTAEILGNFRGDKYSQLNSSFTAFLDEWKKVRNDFNTIRKVMTFFLRLFDTFFCSFRDRISYKVFSRISNIITKQLNFFKNSLKDSRDGGNIYKNFCLFLAQYNLQDPACVIFNACARVDEILGLAEKIKILADNVKTLSSDKNIFNTMKEIGNKILTFYYNSRDNNHLINEIRTPSLFLGDLLTTSESKVATEILRTYKDGVKESIAASRTDADILLIASAPTVADANRAAIIGYFESKKLNDVGVINRKEYNAKLNSPYAEWFKPLNKKSLAGEVTAYGRALFVNDKYAEGLRTSAEKKLNELYNAYKTREKVVKGEDELDKLKEKEEEEKKKITGEKKRKKKSGKKEEKKEGEDEKSISTSASVPLDKLTKEEAINYGKIVAKLGDEKTIELYNKDKGIFKDDEKVKELLETEKKGEEEEE